MPGPVRWVPAGAEVQVGPYRIPGGMLYVGALRRPQHDRDVAVIDPSLPVRQFQPDFRGAGMDYWPAYHAIPPECRAAYLSWLAGGRSAPQAYIGYVFLFFYGLEHRVLVDLRTDPKVAAELPVIRAEVQRLLDLYGHDHSFHGYATKFLDVVDMLVTLREPISAGPPPNIKERTYPPPVLLRIGIGEFAAQGTAVPVDWAYAWAMLHPELNLRTPATRCPQEFRALFTHQYTEKFGAGMTVRPVKRKLDFFYYAASGELRGQQWELGVPDVLTTAIPTRRLGELLDSCADGLDAYSRLIGRNPSAAGTVAGLAVLPDCLLDGDLPALRPLREYLAARLPEGPDPVVVDGAELTEYWPAKVPGKWGKADAVGLAQLLARTGVGVEPDVRMGGPVTSQGPMVVFRLGPDRPTQPSRDYIAATVLLHLAAVVSAADDEIAEQERQLLVTHLESALHLGVGERERLVAHLSWLLAAGVKLTGQKKRLAGLTPAQRSEIADFVTTVAAADGTIAPAEVTAVRKIYTLLELDPDTVYGRLHALVASPLPATEPVTIRRASGQAPVHLVPPEPRRVQLDSALIQAKIAESAAVSALLSEIFVEDEPARPAPAALDVTLVAGLDAAHSTLLHRLTQQATWTRGEIDDLCAGLGLLPDGALDVLNEAAMDASGEPLAEDDASGQILINSYATGELLP
ncbi:putative tellurite resistance protein B-like protein [Kutzneria viridogrisea]|uniref:Tellurite resistance protein B-like protein n=1 Tax=Kutzneria viridogrisea TaxID=47990 RepID=A0ABR6BCE5_9PSEU|nr:putative tellurite resistance protein B-like protein [Kutzneria viridogrisea]